MPDSSASPRTVHGPERPGGQGLGFEQTESAHRAIALLLGEAPTRDEIDLILTHRRSRDDDPARGVYEVWSIRGRVRFRRVIDARGQLDFEVLDVLGENPVERQSPHALRTVDEEKAAAIASGYDGDDPARRFIAPGEQSYPFAYERIAQLFDSPHAPDLALSSLDWCFGTQPGTHGALHVRQARAPLWISGRGVRPGLFDGAARAVDIAPTALHLLGFPLIDGRDATGRRASERGVAPDVYLARQDGRVIEEICERAADSRRDLPRYLHLFLLDGLHHTELEERLANDPEALPNLRRLREAAAVFASGSIVNFPSITWPSHTTIGTGTWCGHHDVVNPSYYLREKREMLSPQGQQIGTEGFANPEVESLYEAFKRVRGDDCLTAAIFAPFGRSADHAVLEQRNLCHKPNLRELNGELCRDEDPRWEELGVTDALRESKLDTRGLAQLFDLFWREDIPSPDFVFHELILTDGVGHDCGPHSEGSRAALDESDRRIGRILDLLEAQGRFDDTLFIVTADHGMAPQDVSRAANPARHILEHGMAAQVADGMIWLLDCAIEVERAADHRTGRVIVREHDPLPSGERPEIEGARVRVEIVDERGEGEWLAEGVTGAGGVYGFATPAEVASERIRIEVRCDGFNARTLTLDGEPCVIDLEAALYGSGSGS